MKIFDFVTGRRAKYVVVAVWFLIVVAMSSTSGRFEDAQNNESESYLPGSAESLKAIELEKKLPGGEQLPGLIVYSRDSGITAADRKAIEADSTALKTKKLDGQIGNPRVFYAKDGKTATLTVVLEANGESDRILDAGDRLRELGRDGPAGLDNALTGGIGYSADAVKVFDSINGTLLFGTVFIVVVLLLVIYRSPFLWLIPLISVAFAEMLSRAAATLLAEGGTIVNSQAASIMTVMVFGVGTDYALLLIARYREELRRHEDKHEAMAFALHRSSAAILASAATVAAALLTMLLADNNGSQSTGPIAAIGVAIAMLAMLTLLPALLLIVGRGAFYPFIPRFKSVDHFAASGFWSALGRRISNNPRPVWLGMFALIAVMSLGWTSYSEGLNQNNAYRDKVDSVKGETLLAKSLPKGATAPTVVIVRGDGALTKRVIDRLKQDSAVVEIGMVLQGNGLSRTEATLKFDPYSDAARKAIPRIRGELKQVAGDKVLVNGQTAVDYDSRVASKRDNKVVIPVALAIVLLILIVLLRATVLPLLLMGTVIISFFASLGASVWVFDHVFGFPGSDPGLPLYVFIFLVALGVDYNIFLMARVREEAIRVGTSEGMQRGLVATGGVITSAAVVLAGTFSVLGSLPLVFMTEIGFAVAFGVLFDAMLVRSILVPALTWDLKAKVWWPSKLARDDGERASHAADTPVG